MGDYLSKKLGALQAPMLMKHMPDETRGPGDEAEIQQTAADVGRRADRGGPGPVVPRRPDDGPVYSSR